MMKKIVSLLLASLLLVPFALAEEGVPEDMPAMMTIQLAPGGMTPKEENIYPYSGLQVNVPQALREMIENREVFMAADENVDFGYGDEMPAFSGTEGPDLNKARLMHASIEFYYVPDSLRSQLPHSGGEDAISLHEDYEPWRSQLTPLGRIEVWNADGWDGPEEGADIAAEENGFIYTTFLNKEIRSEDDAGEASRLVADILAGITATDVRPIDEKYMGAFTPLEKKVGNIGSFTATDLDGSPVTEAVFGDAKLTLVNVWTTWCSPCIAEIPDLAALAEELSEMGIQIVGIVQDATDEEAHEKAVAIRDRTGAGYPIIVPDQALMEGLLDGILGFPTSYLVDGEGNVIGESLLGSRSKEDWKQLLLDALADMGG